MASPPHGHSDSGGDSDKWQKREHYRHQYTPDSYSQKAAYRHAGTSLGFAGFVGHIVRTGGILAPLIVDQFIEDPAKKWKAIRMSAVVAAVVSEVLYAYHQSKGKETCREERESHERGLEENLRAAIAGNAISGGGAGMTR